MYYIHKRHIFFFFQIHPVKQVLIWSKYRELLFCLSGVLYNIRYAIPVCSFNELLQAVVKVLAQVLDVNCFDVISKLLPEPTKVCSGFFYISNDDEHLLYFQISTQFNSFFFVFKTLKNWRIIISVWRQRKLYLEIENQT